MICSFFPFSLVSTPRFEPRTLSTNDKRAKPLDHADVMESVNVCSQSDFGWQILAQKFEWQKQMLHVLKTTVHALRQKIYKLDSRG